MLFPVFVYIIVCVVAVLIPASEGYDAFGWKLLVGQVYALPAFVIASFGSYFMYKKSVKSN